MRVKYFIDYRYEEKVQQFLPIGIWIQDQDDMGIDMYYPDESSDEYWDAMWVMNRLVENDLSAPVDFLEYHRTRAGQMGMRSKVFEQETELNVNAFMKKALQNCMTRLG